MQRLPEFEADHAGAEHRDAFRKIREFEHVFVGEQPVAQPLPRRRKGGRGTCRNDDGRCAYGHALVHDQRRVVDELRVAAQLVAFRNFIHAARDKAHEPITLAADSRHHCLAVHFDAAFQLEAESMEAVHRVRRFGGRDQQLAGHAAHPGARRAVGAPLNEQRASADGLCRAIRRQSGRARADDRHISMEFRVLVDRVRHGDSLPRAATGNRRRRCPSRT